MEILFLIVLIIVGYVTYKCNNHLNYFKKRNIPYLKSFPLVGAFADVFIGRKGLYDCTDDIYNDPKFRNENFFGIFMFHKPSLFIKDPEIIKQILVKDFNNFTNHCGASDVHDPLGNYNLFFVKDDLWKNIRKKLSPFFTSGKMKAMFPILDKISDSLVDHIEEHLNGNNSVILKVKKNVLLYTTDVIASCGFGVDANSLKNPNGEFPSLGRKLYDMTMHRGFEFTSIFMLPEVTKLFNFKLFTEHGTDFIRKTITLVMEERERSKVYRHDLIDALIEIKNSEMKNNEQQPLSMDILIAQAAIFFQAGIETSSSTSTFALYHLAKYHDIQERVRKEIQEALMKSDQKVTYELVMNETPYLHQVLVETLRFYPVIPFLDRECTNPNGYSLEPFSDFVIPYKMPIVIPMYGIQRDEKYYPDPLKFDPDRFSPENIHNVPAFTNLPFGAGNRICIGERFGLLQSKVALIKILMKYRVEMTDKTPVDIKLEKMAFVIQPEVPILLKFIKDKLKFE